MYMSLAMHNGGKCRLWNEIEYEGKRRIKLTHCASLIKRESLAEKDR